MKLPIYFDYASTTPVDPRVANKMIKYLTINGNFGNPYSKFHEYGWQAAEAVDIARDKIASLIGATSLEIIFTSGATESNNLALKGAAYANKNKGNHIITSVTEHKTVLETCNQLEKEGFNITRIVPNQKGIINPKKLNKAIRDNTILISLMHVNNETGIIQDIASFNSIKNNKNILFHVDATQSVGKLPINISILPVDLMSFSAHKIYGPKGIGGLYIRGNKNINIETQMHGGNHERGIRSGTLPVHQIVGMGEAYKIAQKVMKSEIPYIQKLRDMLWNGLQDIEGILINSFLEKTVSNFLNVSFMNINVESLIMYLKKIAVSNGSACNLKSSYVLRAMGINNKLVNNSIRFSLGRFNTIEEIEFSIIYIKNIIKKFRKNIIIKH